MAFITVYLICLSQNNANIWKSSDDATLNNIFRNMYAILILKMWEWQSGSKLILRLSFQFIIFYLDSEPMHPLTGSLHATTQMNQLAHLHSIAFPCLHSRPFCATSGVLNRWFPASAPTAACPSQSAARSGHRPVPPLRHEGASRGRSNRVLAVAGRNRLVAAWKTHLRRSPWQRYDPGRGKIGENECLFDGGFSIIGTSLMSYQRR